MGKRRLRRDFGLELLERLWDKNRMDEDAAMRLAVEAQQKTRPRRGKVTGGALSAA